MTREQLLERLDHPENIAVVHKVMGQGPSEGNGRGENIPDELRVLAGTLAHMDTNKNVGESLGITPQSVSDYKEGRVGEREDPFLGNKVEKAKERSVDLLLQSLGLLTEEKLGKVKKARDLVSIAKDAAAIHDKLTPKGGNNGNQVIIVHAPRESKIEDYPTIDIVPEVKQ